MAGARSGAPSAAHDLYTIPQAAEYAGPGVTARSVRRLVEEGCIESVKWGGRRLVPRAEIDRYIVSRRSVSAGR